MRNVRHGSGMYVGNAFTKRGDGQKVGNLPQVVSLRPITPSLELEQTIDWQNIPLEQRFVGCNSGSRIVQQNGLTLFQAPQKIREK